MIYKITNNITKDIYVGYSYNYLKRWYFHKRNASKGVNTFLYRAMRKYGIENFSIELLEDCDNALNEQREKHWIATLVPRYNMTAGGDGGRTADSPNYKAGIKRRNLSGSNNPNYGKKGPLSPNYGKKYGPNPSLSEAKKKTLRCSNGNTFRGYDAMFEFYNVKSHYSLKKIGITWKEIDNGKTTKSLHLGGII